MAPRWFRRFSPVLYQGDGKRAPYFEGWYFRATSPRPVGTVSSVLRGPHSMAFIPGISRAASGDSAFLQVIDAASGASRFFRYPVEAFSWRDDPFEVRVGNSRFTYGGLEVDAADEDLAVRADLRFGPATPPARGVFPGVMGPFALAPAMECNHGILSLDHAVEGSAELRPAGAAAEARSFDGGRGYAEKDWGTSMPEAWIWMQASSFEGGAGPASLSFSLARVPWRGRSFNGFVCLLLAGGREYRFATYTGARIELLEIMGDTVRVLVGDARSKLEIMLRRDRSAALRAPVAGEMDRRIVESLSSRVRVVLRRLRGPTEDIVFNETSAAAAAEIVGDAGSLR